MLMNVSDLTRAALDYAVAVADGRAAAAHFNPSENWEQGGPIIARERIFLQAPYLSVKLWDAYTMESDTDLPCWGNTGPTPLIAAMRCYVASKLGDTVEIPDEIGAKV